MSADETLVHPISRVGRSFANQQDGTKVIEFVGADGGQIQFAFSPECLADLSRLAANILGASQDPQSTEATICEAVGAAPTMEPEGIAIRLGSAGGVVHTHFLTMELSAMLRKEIRKAEDFQRSVAKRRQ